jgi:hypothetical protein
MAQKNTLYNYFSKSPAQSRVQNGGLPSQTNDNILRKATLGTPTSASKKATKNAPGKTDRKKNTKPAIPLTNGNKQNEGKGN